MFYLTFFVKYAENFTKGFTMAQGQRKVNEIFNNEIFSIPNYQRDYAWGVKNLDDLWEDLLEAEKAKNDEMGHFLGTIVVAKIQKIKQLMIL